MRWTNRRFESVLFELIEENAFAIRPVLKLLRYRFTKQVKTLAVTLSEPPELLINHCFIETHCKTDEQLKAALYHEFLHVILGHTMRFKQMTALQNTALDATINAIIYRQCGPEYASLFAEYYADQIGVAKLLRPMSESEKASYEQRRADLLCKVEPEEMDSLASSGHRARTQLERSWDALYKGLLVADDVFELAETLNEQGLAILSSEKLLLGNHDGIGIPAEGSLRDAIEEALRQMRGNEIWKHPDRFGIGAYQYQPIVSHHDRRIEQWKDQTRKIFESFLIPDKNSLLVENKETSLWIPILSPSDRRAFLRSTWNPIVHPSHHTSAQLKNLGWANVYLDVSASMNQEMPLIISLLHQLRRYIRMPFWAFSNEVQPAFIRSGRLETASTGGTSMACVLEHLARLKPKCAVVFTDGYIEPVCHTLLSQCHATRLAVIVTRDGDPAQLYKAGIPYVQLGELAND